MLTRCPACATHFRVTTEQLKARSGRVRCGECQHVFNAIDALIEEPMPAVTPPVPELQQEVVAASLPDSQAGAAEYPDGQIDELATPPGNISAATPEPPAEEPHAAPAATADARDWSETFPAPPPLSRRWPWAIGCVVALTVLGLQAVLAFRVELAVLWPEARPALVALCDIADCEVGLPAKVGLMGIEASDLHPDNDRAGRLALTATLKNRAPFAQQFPHLELTLTDTADQTIARKVLAPADYLPPKASMVDGIRPNADFALAVGIDSGEMTASGYRLYLFYP